MKKGFLHAAVSMVIVFVAAFMLFFIFDSLHKISEKCKVEEMDICEKLSGFTISMIIVLLMIGGFIGVIAAVAYILISSLSK
jgi:predicted PurR-regulated permease PerM